MVVERLFYSLYTFGVRIACVMTLRQVIQGRSCLEQIQLCCFFVASHLCLWHRRNFFDNRLNVIFSRWYFRCVAISWTYSGSFGNLGFSIFSPSAVLLLTKSYLWSLFIILLTGFVGCSWIVIESFIVFMCCGIVFPLLLWLVWTIQYIVPPLPEQLQEYHYTGVKLEEKHCCSYYSR